MNLAAAYYAADRRLDDARREIEKLLTAVFPGWQSWEFTKPNGIDVYGAFESTRGVARLHAVGFVTVILHDHLATERLITCRCRAFEDG